MIRHSARPRRAVALVLWGLLGILGCGEPTSPGVELARARQRWSSTEPAAYRLTIQQVCYCSLVQGPVEVVVRDGIVQSRRDVDANRPLDERIADAYPNVEGLFALVDAAHSAGAARVDVTFDPLRGYPRRIDLDYRTNLADDERVVTVLAFERL